MSRDSIERRDVLRAAGTAAFAGGILSTQSKSVSASSQKLSILVDSLSNPPQSDEVEIADDDIQFVEADPDAGFSQPYLLYTPSSLLGDEGGTKQPLIVEPNGRGTGDFEVILDSAVRNIDHGVPGRLADRMNTPVLYPLFPRPDGASLVDMLDDTALTGELVHHENHTEVLEGEEYMRYDLQLLAMVDNVQERLADTEFEIANSIRLNGASSSGAFVTRFTILHPERVKAVSAGLIGAITLPKEVVDEEVPADNNTVSGDPLPYPIGVANLDDLVGKEFNREAWKDVDKFLYNGGDDQPDPEKEPVSYRDFENLSPDLAILMFDVFGEKKLDDRFPVSKSVYQAVDPSAQFTVYEGYGHTDRPAQDDIIEFHGGDIDPLTVPKVIVEQFPKTSFGAVAILTLGILYGVYHELTNRF